jgi:hypothetical protein
MKKITAVLIVVFSVVFVAEAQRAVRTVTNADLAKFRDRRVAAEQEYRDNYERLGMPSPEELIAIRDRDMADRLELAQQLRQARIEKERLALDRERLDLESERLALERETQDNDYVLAAGYGGLYGGGFGYLGDGFGGGFGNFRGRRSSFGFPYLPSYRITPTGVIFEPGGRSGNVWSPVPIRPTGPAWRRPGIVFGPGPGPRPWPRR